MAIDMTGTVDGGFASVTVTLIQAPDGDYNDDGIWEDGETTTTTFKACVQPVSPKEIVDLELGSQRITDMRNIYPISNINFNLSPFMRVRFDDGLGERIYRIVKSDLRPWNNYYKIIVEVTND